MEEYLGKGKRAIWGRIYLHEIHFCATEQNQRAGFFLIRAWKPKAGHHGKDWTLGE